MAKLPRNPGRYEFKFCVDGRFVCCGAGTVVEVKVAYVHERFSQDGSGHYNNVVDVFAVPASSPCKSCASSDIISSSVLRGRLIATSIASEVKAIIPAKLQIPDINSIQPSGRMSRNIALLEPTRSPRFAERTQMVVLPKRATSTHLLVKEPPDKHLQAQDRDPPGAIYFMDSGTSGALQSRLAKAVSVPCMLQQDSVSSADTGELKRDHHREQSDCLFQHKPFLKY